jgi:hypothetical protein
LALLADNPVTPEVIDVAALRETVANWSWHTTASPPLLEIARVNRILAFGQFVHDVHGRGHSHFGVDSTKGGRTTVAGTTRERI